LTILSYLGWNAYPIARLLNNVAGEILLEDLKRWKVKDNLLSFTKDGSTPVIIHRILRDSNGAPKHKFEFRNPENGDYLPSYKPFLSKNVPEVIQKVAHTNVYFFDRMNRAAIDLAKKYKERSALIVFEPSSAKDERLFQQSIDVAHVVKFSSDRIADYDQRYSLAVAELEIQTLGADGLKFRTIGQKEWTFLPGFAIDNVVDAAGAGDWSTAGMLKILGGIPLKEWTRNNIVYALQFGQVLSALNCTFEGARGLMEHISPTDLVLTTRHIVDAHLVKIPQKVQPAADKQSHFVQRDIASLFAEV
jgi:sugar/nucleoside kinase (ribokinase family)